MVKRLSVVLAALFLTACSDLDVVRLFLPVGADVNTRVSQSLEWNASHDVKTITMPDDAYRFYVCSDIHVEKNPPVRFRQMVDAEKADAESAFYQALGDFVYGQENMEFVADIMADGRGFAAAGNHDIYFDMWTKWRELFHSSTYYYFIQTTSAKDLFIVLDSANGTLGEIQTQWLQDVLEANRQSCRHCFVSLHHNILRSDTTQFPSSNLQLEETLFLMDLFKTFRVDMVFAGHDHTRSEDSFNSVIYITLDDIKDTTENASYLIVSVSEGISHRFVEFQ